MYKLSAHFLRTLSIFKRINSSVKSKFDLVKFGKSQHTSETWAFENGSPLSIYKFSKTTHGHGKNTLSATI